MDPVTPYHTSNPAGRRSPLRTFAWRPASFTFVLAVAGLLGAGYAIGGAKWPLPSWAPAWLTTAFGQSAGSTTGAEVYNGHSNSHAAHGGEHAAASGLEKQSGDDASLKDDNTVAAHIDHAATGAASADAGGRRILYYRNPMGLPDTSPVPKKDSMGMDYLPVYEGEAEDDSTVKVSPGRLQRTGVRSEPAERRIVTRPVRAPGTIKLDERRVTVVSPRSDTFIEHVENITTGDWVRKDQPLLHLYSPEIAAAGAQYLSVLNEGNGGAGRPLVLEGARRRLENLNVPPEVLAEIERARKVPLSMVWTAPRNGVVLARNVVEGMRAPAGEVLFRIADLSTVWVLADVPEHDLGAVRPGQPVTVRTHTLPGRSFTGRISLIYPQVNPETRTARVRIEIPNPDGLLLPDMYADVEIATGDAKPVVAVPDSALIDTGTRQIVIVDKGEGRFEPRQVKVGARGNGFVEIREGVAAGDQVVTSANFLIDAESNLKAALQGMTAPAEEKPQ
ncbi:efflux RND transporter periplasmic adaptor subunit [Microvirga sp. Mcv34]|uniref:efflux RND transporter periplasmic adaptor subunit n=1 Tax=Microvirga sp. Mcv34 TaxID=2926016 RepID=UPI0021C841CB|nr:efflux RND transporter periplasmic adaptor subunit [Microvirga sp. Mcv34]